MADLLPIALAWYGIFLVGELFAQAFGIHGFYPRSNALSLAALLATIVCLPWGRWRARVAGMLLLGFSFLALADLPHMRFFGRFISFDSIGGGGQLWDLRGSIVDLLKVGDLRLLPIALAGIALAVLWPKVPRPHSMREWGLYHAIPLLILLAGSVPSTERLQWWMAKHESWSVLDMRRWAIFKGFLASHQLDLARTVRESWIREPLSPNEIAAMQGFSAALRSNDPVADQGTAAGLNVLVIQVEAMQHWMVDAEIAGEPVMPFIRRYKAGARYYPNLWDQTNLSPTADCEYLVLNSQHPLQQGSIPFRRPDNDFVTVPKLLRSSASYSTFSAHGFRSGFWNRQLLHPAYGFDESLFEAELGEQPEIGWGLADKEFLERTIPHLQKRRSPWFAYLITLTSHHPYTYIPKDLHELDTGDMPENWAGYVHSMRYVDRALENFFTKAQEAGILDNTLVVIFGDHDSRMVVDDQAAKDAITKRMNLSLDTTQWLASRAWETKRIPLIIKNPRETEGREVLAYGGQMDIGVTVMHLLGRKPSSAFFGRPLVAGDPGRNVVRSDGSFVNAELLWNAETSTCRDTATFTPVDVERCKPYHAPAAQQLAYSSRITLENAAHLLHETGVSTQAHPPVPPGPDESEDASEPVGREATAPQAPAADNSPL